jgi:hypothetical protein
MHLVVAIPPKIAVSKFIGQVKGVASTRFNKLCLSTTPFFWQDEYDVFSFDRKRLPNWAAYAERQKEHHAQGTMIVVLERITSGAAGVLREPMPGYSLEQDAWRRELESLALLDDKA